jgi:hypothetical protein
MVPAATRARLGRIVFLAALCLIPLGCAKSLVTKENFDKVQNGMTLDQVEGVLGRGSPVGDGSLIAAQAGVDLSGGAPPPSTVDYVWESGKKSITVTFNKQNKVVAKRSSPL